MSQREPHAELAAELRQLAQTILDRLDPAVRAAAARAAAAGAGPGRCQQVWCPVCALAALVTGEQHPLLTIVAEHSVGLLAVIRSMTAEGSGGPTATPPERPEDGGSTGANGANAGGYHHIPIVVEPDLPDLATPSDTAVTPMSGDPAVP